VSGAAGEDTAVGRRHVGVGSEDRRRPTVEVPAHRHLLAAHFGVEVDDHRVLLVVAEDRVDGVEGGAGDAEADAAAEVDDPNPHPSGLDQGVAAAGVRLRVVGGADYPVGVFEELVGLAVAVDVVAGGDDVGAGAEEVVGGPLGDPHPASRVLAVDDHQVGRVALAQLRHRLPQTLAAGAADHVADV